MLAALLLLLATPAQAGSAVEQNVSPPVLQVLHQRAASGDAAMLEQLERLAATGDASAIEALGELYARGIGTIPADPARACGYFARIAAVRGDAAHNLAQCFYTGDGGARDLAKARTAYAGALALGYVRSGCALGNMLIAGDGGPRDAPRGVALCRSAAEAGDADAQTDYGGYLLTGTGTPRDAVAARQWLTQAAHRKQANAAFLLGQIYWNGDGTPTDTIVAARWWRVAYDGGRIDAAALLAREAMRRVLVKEGDAARIDPEAAAQARDWLTITRARDPNPEARKTAESALAELERLTAKR